MCSGLLNKSVVNIRRFGKAGRLSAINDSEKRWQVISLGSTQFLYALDFAFTPEINGQNLAFQVQPFLYDLQLLKRFSANVKPGGTVILGVCPFSFCLYDFSPSMRKTYHYKRYDFIFKSGKLSHFPAKWNHSFMKKVYRFQTKKDPDTVSEVPEDDTPSRNDVNWSADAENWMKDWKKSFFAPPDHKELLPLDDVIQKNIGFVNEMITCAMSAGLKPVIVLAPLRQELYDLFPKAQMEHCLYGPLQQILKNAPSVPFFDYMTKPEYQKEEYFRNTLMMSAKGREKFTVELLHELNAGENETC